jgi:hypothetical protein
MDTEVPIETAREKTAASIMFTGVPIIRKLSQRRPRSIAALEARKRRNSVAMRRLEIFAINNHIAREDPSPHIESTIPSIGAEGTQASPLAIIRSVNRARFARTVIPPEASALPPERVSVVVCM